MTSQLEIERDDLDRIIVEYMKWKYDIVVDGNSIDYIADGETYGFDEVRFTAQLPVKEAL